MSPNVKSALEKAAARTSAPARPLAFPGLTLAFFLAMGTVGMSAGVDDLRSASDSALIKVQRAVANEDSEILASVFTEDGAVTVPTGQIIRGRTTIRSMAALMMMTWGGGNLKVTRDTLGLRETTGHEIGRYVFRRSVKDRPDQLWSGGYTVVWEKEAGEWKISRISGLLSPAKAESKKPDKK